MEVDAGGVTRVRSLATLAERLLAQATGAMGHKFWSDYVTVGLAVAWPRADEQEQRLRIEKAIQLTFNDERYLEYGSKAANYDRAILYLRLGDEEKAREALEVLKYDTSLWRLAMGDPDLAPLHDYIAAQRLVRAQSTTHG